MRKIICIYFSSLLLLLVQCSAPSHRAGCGDGKTRLDGVCVDQAVANYVACVRAQGAQLDSGQSQKLAASVKVAGYGASAVSEVKDRLQSRYQASDENVLVIIRACEKFNQMAAPQKSLNISGDWTNRYQIQGGKEVSGQVRFVQTGNVVRGTYGGRGTYEGVFEKNRLIGIWKNGQSSGRVDLKFADDGKSFQGFWGFGTGRLQFWQRGKRVSN